MKRLLSMLGLCLCLAGCIPAIDHPRVERTLDVPEPPAVAWAKAIKATMAVQGQIHYQDVQLGLINATVQKAVALNVALTPTGTGSHIVVDHQVAPTHIVMGTVTVTDDWIAAYRAQP